MKQALRIIALITIFSTTAAAVESTDSTVGSNLPPRIRALLIQEMNAVLDASKKILDALVRGRDEVVAGNAQAIHDSFILKQQMTAADRETLRNSVPEAFIERDRAFHEISGRLAEAARAGNQQLQRSLFADMINACTACHSQHATDRFPELKATE